MNEEEEIFYGHQISPMVWQMNAKLRKLKATGAKMAWPEQVASIFIPLELVLFQSTTNQQPPQQRIIEEQQGNESWHAMGCCRLRIATLLTCEP